MRSVILVLIFALSVIAANAETYIAARSFYANWIDEAHRASVSPFTTATTQNGFAVLGPAQTSTADLFLTVLNVGLLPSSLRVTESTVSSRFVDDHAEKRQFDWHLAGAVALVLALIYSIYLHPLLI